MKCNTFNKNLNDYLDGNITDDLKTAMDKHMNECEKCSNSYKEEKIIDDELKSAFIIDGIQFSSSRTDILNNIDQNRYSRNKTNKIFFYFKKNKYKYMSAAAAAIVLLISIPMFMKNFNNNYISDDTGETIIMQSIANNAMESVNDVDKDENLEMNTKSMNTEEKIELFDIPSSNEESDEVADDAISNELVEQDSIVESQSMESIDESTYETSNYINDDSIGMVEINTANNPETYKSRSFEEVFGDNKNTEVNFNKAKNLNDVNSFENDINQKRIIDIKQSVRTGYTPEFSMTEEIDKQEIDEYSSSFESVSAKYSPNNELLAVIPSHDWGNVDLGVNDIWIKDLNTDKIMSYKLVDNDEQNTPMNLEWWDDEHLLVIIGYGYGTISKGGSIYILNVNTAEIKLIYEKLEKEFVYRATKKQNDIHLDVMVYDDDNYNEYHMEQAIIKNYKLSD